MLKAIKVSVVNVPKYRCIFLNSDLKPVRISLQLPGAAIMDS